MEVIRRGTSNAGKSLKGKAFILYRTQAQVEKIAIPASAVEGEVIRFNRALDQARQELQDVRGKIPNHASEEMSSFIDIHLLMIEDQALTTAPIKIIEEQGCNAEWALKLQHQKLKTIFTESVDPYLVARIDDVGHVITRVQRVLLGQADEQQLYQEDLKGQIIVARNLSTADIVMMSHQGAEGFITEMGGVSSHAAILARNMGLPMVLGVNGIRKDLKQACALLIDGYSGTIYIEPSSATLHEYEQRELQRVSVGPSSWSPLKSKDGIEIKLRANSESVADIEDISSYAEGIGLYRTEFLFIGKKEIPDEEAQLSCYLSMIKALNGAPLVIRTLDLEPDKWVGKSYVPDIPGLSPALGMKSIRAGLNDPESIMLPQLRAILRASAFGKVSIMMPMLTCVEELQEVLLIIEGTQKSLIEEGYQVDENLKIGAVVEVPSAAITADMFARQLDFMSIGTNDLTQYVVAADRLDDSVSYLYNPANPAVLRLIHHVVMVGERAGIPVSLCGEMAGELKNIPLLLGLGLRELSMSPMILAEARKVIEETDISKIKEQMEQLLAMSDIQEFTQTLQAITAVE